MSYYILLDKTLIKRFTVSVLTLAFFLMTFSKTSSCTYVQTTHKTDNCCEYDKKINSNSLLDCIFQQCVIDENKKYISDIAPCKKSKKLKETEDLKINK